MEAIRKIVESSKLLSVMDLPESMRIGRLEIIVMPLIDESKPKESKKSMKGFLKDFADPSLVMKEKGAWERSVIDKYGSF